MLHELPGGTSDGANCLLMCFFGWLALGVLLSVQKRTVGTWVRDIL